MAKVRVQELDVEDYDLNVDSYDEELYRKIPGNEKNSSYRNDKQDKKNIILSNHINTPVENLHKIILSFDCGRVEILVPKDIGSKETKVIKDILDSITN